MAIANTVRPEAVVSGFVTSIRERWTRDRDRIYRRDVTIQQDTPRGTTGLTVEYWVRDGEPLELPGVGTMVAVVAEVGESAQYGASLSYLRDLTADDLEAMASIVGLVASGK